MKCKDNIERKEEIRKRAEYIANGIMIDVQANKYNTNVYDYEKECYKHSHLMDAAIDAANWADEHPRKGLVDIDNVLSILKVVDYKEYISSITNGVGVISFNVDNFIEDVRKTI